MEEQIKNIKDMVEDFMGQLDAFRDTMKFVELNTQQGIEDYAKELLPRTISMLTNMAAVNCEHYNKIYEAVYDLADRKDH